MARGNTAPAWRRAFLRELGRSGTVARAAETCGIDRSTAYQMRKANPAFAKSWDRALETAREALSPRAGGDLGEPRLEADQVVRSSKTGHPCIARVGPGRWSARSERAFLEELTATANVKAAARAAGFSTISVYNRRKLWPAFAEAWRAALAEGYVRIETLLIHAATSTLDPEPSAAEARETPIMSVEQAMNLFKLHRAEVRGRAGRPGSRATEPDIEDVRAEILRKVAAIEKARG